MKIDETNEIDEIDLFGNKIIKKITLRDKFIEPPFSVLDSKSGSWQNRKKKWRNIGIKSEIGRDININGLNGFNLNNNYETRKKYNGTSIFDPVLCELMYSWFVPKNGTILDPFAGGSVRGIVAQYLKYKYTGIELRAEQVISNREQGLKILEINNQPNWYIGDSNKLLKEKWTNKFDFIFSCPPYGNLEVYSKMEEDISNMDYEDFLKVYRSIIANSCNLLKNNGFACFVVGEIRDKNGNYRGFVADTINAFKDCGMSFYNDAIFLESGLNTAAMRANKYMKSKKLVKIHQNILIFKRNLE